jgi:CRISPR-associated protein Cas6
MSVAMPTAAFDGVDGAASPHLAPMTDVAFGLCGASVPAEHAEALAQAVGAWLPWLARDRRCGIHPLRTAGAEADDLLLARRTRLLLRVPVARVPDALALAGCTLAVESVRLVVGEARVRPLQAWPTLHAQQVVSDAADAASFEARAGALLSAQGVRCGVLAGRAAQRRTRDGNLAGFALLLHGLAEADSLAVQCAGMGPARHLGCGLFVPHKGVAAVS